MVIGDDLSNAMPVEMTMLGAMGAVAASNDGTGCLDPHAGSSVGIGCAVSLLPDPSQSAVMRETAYPRFLLGSGIGTDAADYQTYRDGKGYDALERAVMTMMPLEVDEEIRRADFLDRDGGGLPAYCKWETVQDSMGAEIVLVCNVAYHPDNSKEALLIESNPHQLIEGVVIAAYAVGAKQAFIYIPEIYRCRAANLESALSQAIDHAIVGVDILDSGAEVNVSLRYGPTIYSAGEETIPLEALEGKAARPRLGVRDPAVEGYRSLPTLVHSVETLMNLPVIIGKGADWYQTIGVDGCNGTRLLTILGDVNEPGVIEVPCGITVREAIFLAGGSVGDHLVKAVVNGGVGGLTLSEDGFDTPIMADGSGTLIVLDDTRCMTEAAYKNAMFFASQSCGQCRSCKEGSATLASILRDMMLGHGHAGDLEVMEELASQIGEVSRCRRGQSGPSVAYSAIQSFRSEFRIHVEGRVCPVGACPMNAVVESAKEI